MAAPTDPERDPLFRALIVIMAVAVVVVLAFDAISHQTGVARAANTQAVTQAAASSATVTYKPQPRNLIVTAVPLLVHEQAGFFDYLNKDFGKKGMLRDKEVWAFSPNTLTVYQGDTVHVTVVNPGDDPHTFTIAEMNFSISVPGQSQVDGSFVVPSTGLFKFFCAIPEHMPYMWGNLVVLPDSAAPQG